MLRMVCLFMLCAIIAPAFVSCGDDEPLEVITPEEPATPEEPEEPTPSTPVKKILLKVTDRNSFTDGTSYVHTAYEVEKYEVNKWSNQTVVIQFSTGTKFIYKYDLPYSISLDFAGEEINNKLNNMFIESQEAPTLSGDNYQYIYDSKARLSECRGSLGSRVVYNYDNNYNIVKITNFSNDEKTMEINISYNDLKSKTIPLQAYEIGFGVGGYLPGFYNINLYEAGFYGVSIPINLMARASVTYTSSSLNSYDVEYEYTFDADGYVDTMTEYRFTKTETFIDNYSFTWGQVSANTYTNWLFNDIRSPYYRLLQK